MNLKTLSLPVVLMISKLTNNLIKIIRGKRKELLKRVMMTTLKTQQNLKLKVRQALQDQTVRIDFHFSSLKQSRVIGKHGF